jgi:hypothetical protein
MGMKIRSESEYEGAKEVIKHRQRPDRMAVMTIFQYFALLDIA